MLLSDKPRLLVSAAILSLVLTSSPRPTLAQSSGQIKPLTLSQQAVAQINAINLEKAARTPAQCKLDSSLLLGVNRAMGRALPAGYPELRTTVTADADNRTLVDIKAIVSDALLARINSLDGQIVNSFARYGAIRAHLPLPAIETLAEEPAVRSIRPALKPMLHKVDTSEGDIAHRAAAARAAFGVTGSPVKVGVLSDSVEALADLQASGDLPAVTVLTGQAGSGSSEGTAMLEIVHDLAPGANLYFATAWGSEASFANNILALRAAGCQVIVDDVLYITEPVFQDGIIAQAVETACAAGAVYFSSAGNSGNKNDNTSGVWEGDFVPVAAPAAIGGTAHDFGGTNSNLITRESPWLYSLQWADPAGASTNDYDLYLLDATLNTVIDASTNPQNGAQDPLEVLIANGPGDVGRRLVVIKKPAAQSRYLSLNTNGGILAISTAGQTWGHSAAASAFGVAAVRVTTAAGGPFTGGLANPVEFFSSDGPRRIFYYSDGAPITPGNFTSTGGTVRQKPDIAAADGVSTATPGFKPFYGTSAAAPHAAAVAALVRSAQPSLTPAQIRTILTSTALDIEDPGVDRDSGYGIVDAQAALATIAPTVSSVTATNPNGSYGTGATINIQVAFSMPVTVTGSPRLALNTTPSRQAQYSSGSGSNTLTFTYNVQNGDICTDLDYAGTNALSPTGAISNAGSTLADLTLPAPGASGSLGYNKNIAIHAAAPNVAAISVPSPATTATGPVTFTVNFDEPVTGFSSAGDVQVNATGNAAAGSVTINGSGAGPYTVTLAAITGDGTLGVTVNAGACIDAPGNPNTASATSSTVIVDNTAPVVSAISAPSATSTTTGPVTYEITFSEPVTGFDSAADIQLNTTGTATPASVTVTGSGAGPYVVTLATISGNGTLGITANANACTDIAGNPNTASAPSATFTVHSTNLRLAQPAAWPSPLILSTQTGTSTSDLDETATLEVDSANPVIYLDFAVQNAGSSDVTQTVSIGVYLDDVLVTAQTIDAPFAAGTTRELLDIPVNVTNGNHTLRITIDPANLATETDTTDNTVSTAFTVVLTSVDSYVPPAPVRSPCGLGIFGATAAILLALTIAQLTSTRATSRFWGGGRLARLGQRETVALEKALSASQSCMN